ncbi:MAG: HAD-IC family P-type ATPase [Actinomycetota bacterium]
MAHESTQSRLDSHENVPWHALESEQVQTRLETGPDGLSGKEAAARLARFGANQIEDEASAGALVVLLRQFRSPLIYILLAAAGITALLEEYIDAGVIAFVLVLNAAIGFTQERKAEGAVRALMQLVVPKARVVRDGREFTVDSRQLVVGDAVLLESGARIPADLRLAWTNGLHINESLLTGESLPPAKHHEPVDSGASLADRHNMAYTGTVVTSGRGLGLVTATGSRTELGTIAGLIRSEAVTQTPLQERMGQFARVIGVAVGVASVVAFVSGLALGGSPQEMFLTAVALAVAAIPEGLPAVFTITLALGVRRMARRHAIIRRLPAVETLGSTTVIGSDKTGTLTENRMTVQQIWAGGRMFEFADGGGDDLLCDGEPATPADHPALRLTVLTGVLTNEAQAQASDRGVQITGDPTEGSLLMSAVAIGIRPDQAREDNPAVADIPFEPEHGYSATLRSRDEVQTLYVKGAPERVTAMCTHMLVEGKPEPIDVNAVHQAAHQLAEDGLRVLAFAYRETPTPIAAPNELSEPRALVFLGLQGMMDPPRAGVREAVSTCRKAGIRVVMITGDHRTTALAIARSLGLCDADATALTGAEMAAMSAEQLIERAASTSVYARASPEQKLRIVKALQQVGNVVAVTGDGVNDAPALKAADIGVAMGRSGTDVAREASDMVLTDDNFVSIAAAVEEGRVTFDNVRKVTFFLVSTGAAAIAAILVGVWARWPLIMLPAQLLWLNLVTSGLQDVALAFEPGDKDVLKKPPRPRTEGILSRMLWGRTALAGLVMAAGTLMLFRWELDRTGSLPQAQTVALTTMVVFMAFHAGNCRSESASVLRISPISNPFLLIATTAALGLHAAALYLAPTQFVLRVEPIDAAAWIRIVSVATTILVAIELHKFLLRRRTSHLAGTSQAQGGLRRSQ